MTASTAGLLTSMHQNELGSLHSHAASSFQQPYGSSEWQISSSPLYTETQRQSTSQSTTPGSPTVDAHADAAQSAGEIGAQDYRRRHPEDAPARPLFTACVGTDYSL